MGRTFSQEIQQAGPWGTQGPAQVTQITRVRPTGKVAVGVRPLRTSRGGREEPREPERAGLRVSEEPQEPEPVAPA